MTVMMIMMMMVVAISDRFFYSVFIVVPRHPLFVFLVSPPGGGAAVPPGCPLHTVGCRLHPAPAAGVGGGGGAFPLFVAGSGDGSFTAEESHAHFYFVDDPRLARSAPEAGSICERWSGNPGGSLLGGHHFGTRHQLFSGRHPLFEDCCSLLGCEVQLPYCVGPMFRGPHP